MNFDFEISRDDYIFSLKESSCCSSSHACSTRPQAVPEYETISGTSPQYVLYFAHCKQIRRFYGKIPGIGLPVILPLF